MREEEAFLDRLAEDPLDGLTRSVYADWLEDRSDPRADFLRAEAAYAASPSDETRIAVERLASRTDEGWMLRAGAKWDLVLLRYPPRRKIPVIKRIRELRMMGLYDAKKLSESLPAVVLPGVPWFLASSGRKQLHDLMGLDYGDESQADEPAVAAEIRTATEETALPGSARALPSYVSTDAAAWLRLDEVRPEHALEVARALVPRLASSLFVALDLVAGPKPVHLESSMGELADEEFIGTLAGKATLVRIEAVAGDRRFDRCSPVAAKLPAEEMPRAARAFVRVLGREGLLTGAGYWGHETRLRRFRAEEIAARLGGITKVEIITE